MKTNNHYCAPEGRFNWPVLIFWGGVIALWTFGAFRLGQWYWGT